ncbi:MAG: isochorismatase family protein [Actinomycetota bacterium]
MHGAEHEHAARAVVSADDTVLVVIDMQESLANVMDAREAVTGAAVLLVQAAGRLGLPMTVTRQNPAALGETIAEVREVAGVHAPVDKMAFDATHDEGFIARLEQTGRRTVVLAGMETHICVTQTALGLLRAGYAVHVAADAVCSRRSSDHAVALERLRAAGAIVTTAESVVYEALGEAGTDRFRDVLRSVKARPVP